MRVAENPACFSVSRTRPKTVTATSTGTSVVVSSIGTTSLGGVLVSGDTAPPGRVVGALMLGAGEADDDVAVSVAPCALPLSLSPTKRATANLIAAKRSTMATAATPTRRVVCRPTSPLSLTRYPDSRPRPSASPLSLGPATATRPSLGTWAVNGRGATPSRDPHAASCAPHSPWQRDSNKTGPVSSVNTSPKEPTYPSTPKLTSTSSQTNTPPP